LKRHGAIALAVAVYWIATAVLVVMSTRQTGGHLVYPLDDAYVHMAIAKNVALHHVWGVTRYGFTSSTSSPLWTLLLSLTFIVFGAGGLAPLLFNVAAGTAIVVTIGRFMEARSASPVLTGAVLLIVIFITPLPTLTMSGMEHTAHALATLWFVFTAAAWLGSTRPTGTKRVAVVGLLAALVTALRYEGIFTVVLVILLFAIARRWREAAFVGVGGALPIAVYGLWSMAHGWYFLPNSVLLKGQAPSRGLRALLAFVSGSPALHNLLANPHILLLVVAALALLVVVTADLLWSDDIFLLTILIGTTLLHMQLARAGWFYRYEAYQLVLGAAVFGVIAADRLPPLDAWFHGAAAVPRAVAVAALIAVAGFPFASRGLNAWRNTPTAAANIYSQQYQMGLFADLFYQGQTIALNDIGAVGYLGDARLFDIFGLANVDIARLKRDGRYQPAEIASLADRQGAAIAMVYPSWLNESGGVPAGWTKVGEWGVRDNVVLGENAVSFYAVEADQQRLLTGNLRRFAPLLPASVIQGGEYTR
jgi:hypothetical protein